MHPNALSEIEALISEKQSWTPAQQKLESQLIHACKQSRGQGYAPIAKNLMLDVKLQEDGRVMVDINANVTPALLTLIERLGGTVINNYPQYRAIRALLPLEQLESLADVADVGSIQRAAELVTNIGSVNSQGDTTHRAASSRSLFSVDGAGIAVGVLSDSVDFLANSQASGNLGAVTVLPGQNGVPATGEGTAMLEIVRDLAPGSPLLFATGNGGPAAMAANITALFTAGCKIIVDDLLYANESPFQDGVIAQAVNAVTVGGAMYFSSASNSRNLDSATSSTWEGDFVDGGAAGAPIVVAGRLHNFGGSNYNTVTATGNVQRADLFWTDPLGAATNDYDLFVLNATGTTVLRSSMTRQTGAQDPYETVSPLNLGERIVIVRFSGTGRFLHLTGNRCSLAIATAGSTRGHNCATNALGVAAVNASNAFPNPFVGGAINPFETFSADGPRRVFFHSSGTPITPGNFSSSGGAIRLKPDIAAADGVSTSVMGFGTFFGTSAAAPHAAAIAALLWSKRPTLTASQVREAMTSTALDVNPAGVDRNTGVGIVMAYQALNFLDSIPVITVPGSVEFPDTCVGASSFATLYVCNTGKRDLEVLSIGVTNAQFTVMPPSSGFPVAISPDFCFPFRVRFAPTATGYQTNSFIIVSNDPLSPTNRVPSFGKGSAPVITTVIPDSGNFGNVCVGSFKDLTLFINNSGGCDLYVTNVSSSSGHFLVPGVMPFPLLVHSGDTLSLPIRFQPTNNGAKMGMITIESRAPAQNLKMVSVSGNSPTGDIRITGSTDFGRVCAGELAEKIISICNVGWCDLRVTNVYLTNLVTMMPCDDFQLVNTPFPTAVSHGFCIDQVIRFTPTSCGPKTCTVVILSDDPDQGQITLTLTADAPCAIIDVPPDLGFAPEVIQSDGACTTALPFPISNNGECNLYITAITIGGANAGDFSFSGLPSFPIILQPGHIVGEGDLNVVFAPTVIDRDREATITVTYLSDPIAGTTTSITRKLCGEGVHTGARVLVTHNGIPIPQLEKIHLQRINANRNRDRLDTQDQSSRLPLVTLIPAAPCEPFQYHREYGTVDNPIQLLPGVYQISVSAIINGKRQSKTIGFNVDTCDFNANIVIDF